MGTRGWVGLSLSHEPVESLGHVKGVPEQDGVVAECQTS
jgi:hypothetical protein